MRDYGQRVASWVNGRYQFALAIGSKSQAGTNVFLRQVWKVVKDFVLGHARGQIFQHIVHRDAHATDAGLSTALARFDRNSVLVIHRQNLLSLCYASFPVSASAA